MNPASTSPGSELPARIRKDPAALHPPPHLRDPAAPTPP